MEELINKLEMEKQELEDKLEKLDAFMESVGYIELTDLHKKLLHEQASAMTSYAGIIRRRLAMLRQ